MNENMLSYSMNEIHNSIPCSWNPRSKEVFLINFISILSEYDELDKSPQGANLYEQVKTGFFEQGLSIEDVDKSFKLAKCMLISQNLLKVAKISYDNETVLTNAKNLLSNIEKKDEILASFTKEMLIN